MQPARLQFASFVPSALNSTICMLVEGPGSNGRLFQLNLLILNKMLRNRDHALIIREQIFH